MRRLERRSQYTDTALRMGDGESKLDSTYKVLLTPKPKAIVSQAVGINAQEKVCKGTH